MLEGSVDMEELIEEDPGQMAIGIGLMGYRLLQGEGNQPRNLIRPTLEYGCPPIVGLRMKEENTHKCVFCVV